MQTIKNDLYALVDEIIHELKNNDVPPIPENFRFYFDKKLESKNDDFREQITAISSRSDEYRINNYEYEKSLHHGAKAIKMILMEGSNVYKNTTLLKQAIRHKKEMVRAQPSNGDSLIEVALSVENVLDRFLISLEKQASSIKSLYATVAQSIKEAKDKSFYNATLGVFNQKYLLSLLETERLSCQSSTYKSSLLAISLSSLTPHPEDKKQFVRSIRLLSNLLSGALRRSDALAYSKDGIFSVLLRHTDDDAAEIAAKRFKQLIQASHPQPILIGIVQIDACLSAEEILEQSIEAMHSAAHIQKADPAESSSIEVGNQAENPTM